MSTTRDPIERVQTVREERKSSRRRLLGTAAASAAVLGGLKLPSVQPAAAQDFRAAAHRVFVNPYPINILDQQPADPYPSIITVSGMPGSIGGQSAVKVGINGLTHERVKDIQMCLVSPTGIAVWLMGTVGADTTSASNMQLLIFDDAPGAFPTTDFNSGAYRPTNTVDGNSSIFPFPAPTNVTSESLNSFSGLAGNGLNGQWKLYVLDNRRLAAGIIHNGWTLDIRTTNSAPIARRDSYIARPGRTLIVNRPGVLRNDIDPDGDVIRVVPFAQDTKLGRIKVKGNGSFRFDAKAGARGIVRIPYTITDTSGLVATGQIKITVRPRARG